MNHKKDMKEAAVIDIDSNALKMRISQLKKGRIVDIDRLERPIRVGHEVFTDGRISFESLRELSSLLRGYSEIMKEYGVGKCRVVATTALREAANRAYILDQLKIQNGMTVEVLEEDQEKTLIYDRALELLEEEQKKDEKTNALIAYIGAGTIGLCVFEGEQAVFTQNIPMGSLKLHEMLGSIRNLTGDYHTVVEEYLDTVINRAAIPFQKGPVSKLVLTGGCIRLIARLCSVKPSRGCFELEAKKLRALFEAVCSMPQEKAALTYKISEEDAELLFSSLAIIIHLLGFATSEKIVFMQAELWDTLIQHMLVPKSRSKYLDRVCESALSCAREVAAAYRCNAVHSECIRNYACKIFDRMKGAHGLDRRKRLLLELASILHESGYYVAARQHHISSFDLIKDTGIYGMTDEEMLIAACVARYNEFDVPDFDSPLLRDLSVKNRLVVSKLVAIFRLANALDKSHRQKLGEIKARVQGNRLLISAKSDANLYLEKWAFEQCAPFFQEVFGYHPELSIKSPLV